MDEYETADRLATLFIIVCYVIGLIGFFVVRSRVDPEDEDLASHLFMLMLSPMLVSAVAALVVLSPIWGPVFTLVVSLEWLAGKIRNRRVKSEHD